MKHKNIKLKVLQNDLLQNKTQHIFSGDAQFLNTDTHYQISYQEDHQTDVMLKLENDNISLKRSTENLVSELLFDMDQITTGSVTTDEGKIELDIRTIELIIDSNRIVLFYDVMNQNDIVSRFKIDWEWTDEQN